MAKIYEFVHGSPIADDVNHRIDEIAEASEVLNIEGEHFVCTCVLSDFAKNHIDVQRGYIIAGTNEGLVSVSLNEIDKQDNTPIPKTYAMVPPWIAIKMASQLLNAAYEAMAFNEEKYEESL